MPSSTQDFPLWLNTTSHLAWSVADCFTHSVELFLHVLGWTQLRLQQSMVKIKMFSSPAACCDSTPSSSLPTIATSSKGRPCRQGKIRRWGLFFGGGIWECWLSRKELLFGRRGLKCEVDTAGGKLTRGRAKPSLLSSFVYHRCTSHQCTPRQAREPLHVFGMAAWVGIYAMV